MTTLGIYSGVPRDVLGYLNAPGPTTTQYFRANMPRVGLADSGDDVAGNTALPNDGSMVSTPIFIGPNETITSISFLAGQTAANAPTHWWFALYDRSSSAPALLAQAVDQVATAWPANTWKTLALSAPQTIYRPAVYWAAILFTGTGPPSLVGGIGARPFAGNGEVTLAQTSGSGLTTTAPATIVTPTARNFVPLVVLS